MSWTNDMNSTVSHEGGFTPDESRRAGDGEKREDKAQNIFPVLIGHLNKFSATDSMKIWNIPVRMVTFIGLVREIELSTTKITYMLEDETGTIQAVKWLEADKKIAEPDIVEKSLIRVIGLLREQSGKRHVLILRILCIENFNEVVGHQLEVTYAFLKAKEMALKKSETITTKSENNGSQTFNSGDDDISNPYYGMTADQAAIYKIINAENDSECGIEKSELKARVPKRILPQLDEMLEFLVSEGHIYTTSTDYNFKTT